MSFSPRADAKTSFPVKLRISYTSAYNDNILKYSARDLDRFKNDTEVYPSEITTTDDWVNSFSFRIYRDVNLGHRWKLRPYYHFRIALNAVNQQKNLTSHLFLTRFSYRYRYYFYLQYSYTPGYYLRIYKDRDTDQYHSCDYNAYRQTVRLRWRLKLFEVEGKLEREYLYYNAYFTEYDSEALLRGGKISFHLPRNLDLSFGYEWKRSDNIGFQPLSNLASVDPTQDTEYGDSSYEEDRFRFGLDYPLHLQAGGNWQVGFGCEWRQRYYQSAQSLAADPFHAGRRDHRRLFDVFLGHSLTAVMKVKLVFSYDQRRTASSAHYVPEIKNYDNRIYELVVSYNVF